jgi:hypothetical protein
MGWQCAVKKDEFKLDDLAVYFEVDRFLPEDDRYEFLRKTSWRDNADNGKGFRITTIKLRGQFSQGLLLPFTSFPEMAGCSTGVMIGDRPYGIPASDEIRIQSATELPPLGKAAARLRRLLS